MDWNIKIDIMWKKARRKSIKINMPESWALLKFGLNMLVFRWRRQEKNHKLMKWNEDL